MKTNDYILNNSFKTPRPTCCVPGVSGTSEDTHTETDLRHTDIPCQRLQRLRYNHYTGALKRYILFPAV